MATLLESYTDCFKKYATFRGRSARQEYAVFTVANFVLSFVLGLIPVIGGLFGLVIIIPGLAVAVRRLHDLNRSGWLLLAPYAVMIVAFIGLVATSESGNTTGWFVLLCISGIAVLVMSLWMLFAKGTAGSNRFGDDTLILAPVAAPEMQAVPANNADDVRERLAQAKKMFDEGLISEAEYETMRSGIIKDM
ncbi:DUF805 domain-containing protein [Yokenella regensburgei]|uniref:DUF805 domain-containing protein n=1 Tax=Yokenella regensburgei TaxID=158877 RepID=UPI00289C1965|nr:DUF805 domain-containing protein [Yokenella regensburgei]